MDTNENTSTKDKNDSLKKLEQQKLKAEINDLNRSIFQRPSFYVAMLPVILGIFTLIFSAASGYFDVRIEKIENRKEILEYQEEKLEDSVAILSKNYEFKEAEYKQYLDGLTAEFDSIQREQNKVLESISTENTKVKTDYNKNITDLRKSEFKNEELRTKLEESYLMQKNQLLELKGLKTKFANEVLKTKNLDKDKLELKQTINQLKRNESPWILISNTKPEPDEKILLYSENPIGWYNNVRVGYYSSKNKGFYVLNGRNANLTNLATHWKYIEQPKD